MKQAKGTSLAAALVGWLLLSTLNLFVIWALRDRARLIRDNDNERILNTLFTGMRNFSDLGSAIESDPVLLERIKGAAIYENDLHPVQQWGTVPPVFDEEILKNVPYSRFGRYTIPDRRGRSAQFVIRFERMAIVRQQDLSRRLPGRQGERPAINRMESSRGNGRSGESSPANDRLGAEQVSQPFPGLLRGRYFYTDISHPAYWRTRSITTLLFPLIEIILLFMVQTIRLLYLRNREYREKIEAQQNLVVLGTAAATLAHEIKNPLLSIRLQTGILEKTGSDKESNELKIINQEVDRLSSLVYRVNDYLREPDGNKEALNISALIAETAQRMCNINMPSGAPVMIFADKERIRSVLENVLQNALESGSPVSEIGIAVDAHENKVQVTICDSGQGIDKKEISRIYDPFFSRKSKGTGIGLAISKRFTEAAGGSISAENRDEGGLRVTLVFPQYNGAAHARTDC